MKHVGFLRLEVRWPTHLSAVSSGPHARVIVHSAAELNIRAVSSIAGGGGKVPDKPSICTADELHYVPVPGSHWRLALWRYRPSSPVGVKRNHPLLLLSGLGTNAIGYDLAPGSSFARNMSLQGFDTWILEVRGAGLSVNDEISFTKVRKSEAVNRSDDLQLREKLKDAFVHISEGFSNLLNAGLARTRLDSAIANQVRIWRKAEGQRSVDLEHQFSSLLDDFQKQLDVIVKYDWDFDHYLEEDVPAAMDYIRTHCKPKDGKLLAIGHSLGGILLYAMLSRNAYKGRDSELASVVTLASSLDYSTSRSSLRLLLPLVDPAQALSVPVVPLGAFMSAAYPLASRPPYLLSWLNPQVSAQNMMQPEMRERLLLKNLCTIPAKLLMQLRTVFQEGGLRDRSKTFIYMDHLRKSKVPILALAGDQDLVCPLEAVYETVKLLPGKFVKFKVFGEPRGPHYAHYDLVGSRLVCTHSLPSKFADLLFLDATHIGANFGLQAPNQVYPCIVEFLQHHDLT